MKKYFILFVILLVSLSVFADDAQLSNTLVPKTQQPEIQAGVYATALRTAKRCKNANLKNIEVTSVIEPMRRNKDGKAISGEWIEEWTVEACGVELVVPVSLKQIVTELSTSKNRIYSSYHLKYKFLPVQVK